MGGTTWGRVRLALVVEVVVVAVVVVDVGDGFVADGITARL
jgi:hypothetical protein